MSARIAVGLLLLALVWGARAEANGKGSDGLDFAAVRRVEREIDSRLERFQVDAPMEVIGATRAVYLHGTGLVFSIEVSLAPAVGISPFFHKLPDEDVAKLHQVKLSRVPVLRAALLELLPRVAQNSLGLAGGDDVVLAATLFYFPYEKRENLPRQMVVRAPAEKLRGLSKAGQAPSAERVMAVANVSIY